MKLTAGRFRRKCDKLFITEIILQNHSFSFISDAPDKIEIFASRHLPGSYEPAIGTDAPCAAVVISHGMGDYRGRYEWLAEQLCLDGFAVYICDHRGHGETGSRAGRMGVLAQKDGWNRTVSDLLQLAGICRDEHPGLPVFLLGHSFGSFLALSAVIRKGGIFSGLILSGSGLPSSAALGLGRLAAGTGAVLSSQERALKIVNMVFFAGYSFSVKKTETHFDWVCSDMDVVRAFVADPLSMFMYSNGFYLDLIRGLKSNRRPEKLSKIPPNLPVLFISGTEDPVGDFTKGVRKAAGLLADTGGIEDISCIFYDDERHEVFNGHKKDKAAVQLLDWMNQRL